MTFLHGTGWQKPAERHELVPPVDTRAEDELADRLTDAELDALDALDDERERLLAAARERDARAQAASYYARSRRGGRVVTRRVDESSSEIPREPTAQQTVGTPGVEELPMDDAARTTLGSGCGEVGR